MSGRIRTIKPELLEDEKTASLKDDEFRLFVGLLLLADDHGNFRANPTWLLGQVFWCATPSRDPREILARLSDVGLVTLYRVSSQPYGHVRGWDKHQRIDHPSKPRVPGPELAEKEPETQTLARPSRDPRETLGDWPRPSRLTSDLRSGPPTPTIDLSSCDNSTAAPSSGRRQVTPADLPLPLPVASKPAQPSPVELVFDYWRAHLAPKAKLDDKRRAVIARALKTYSVEELRLAVDGTLLDDWRMGRDPRTNGKRYVGVDLVFRDAEHIDKAIALVDSPPALPDDEPGHWIPEPEPEPDPPGEELVEITAERIDELLVAATGRKASTTDPFWAGGFDD